MCGFVAAFNSHGLRGVDSATIASMCDTMAHRGPDHFGHCADHRVCFGHRRLSIIDLSSQANQPMRVGSTVVAYNGEIYNYVEVRETLVQEEGVTFDTRSDTEVLVRAYQAYGPDCVRRFNGMFSFALWDSEREEFFAARDRLGVKPLFYRQEPDGTLYLASDIKALWEVFNPADDLDRSAIIDCLVNGFFTGGGTSSRRIRRFPPGHVFISNAKETRWERYWNLNDAPRLRCTFSDAVARTEDLLEDAVRLRLRSDVPLGTFLSGGIDSSLVTALVARASSEAVHSFSIGVDSPEFDESRYAYTVADKFGTTHHHVMLDASSLESLPEIVWMFSDLFGDSSALPAYHVAREAADHLQVVFSGDGADEGFGGYVIPFAVDVNRYYRRVPGVLRRAAARPLRALSSGGTGFRWLARLNDMSFMGLSDIYRTFSLRSVWGPYADAFRPPYDDSPLGASVERCTSDDPLNQILYGEIQDRLIDDYLVKVDMSTMAHSLEGRSPFMDYRLQELAYGLPSGARYRGFRRKAVLKKICERFFDNEFIYRRKMGFSIPLARWLSSSQFAPSVRAIVRRPSFLHDLIDESTLKGVMDEFEVRPEAHASRVWSLVWFQIWEGLFVSRCYDRGSRLTQLESA